MPIASWDLSGDKDLQVPQLVSIRKPDGSAAEVSRPLSPQRQVSALLDTKAPGDAAAFKAWLQKISQSTAEAATEGGGLFGLGGVQVSDAEKATLTEISTALGT